MTLLTGASGQDQDTVAQPSSSEAAAPAVVSIVYDVDGYSRSVEGVDIEVVRTGLGLGPSLVRTVQTEDLVATESTIQFPMYSRATIGDGHVIATCVIAAPPESRWCGIDLEPGMIVVHGPGAEHTAVNPIGARFAFAVATQEDLERISDERGRRFSPPPRGEVHALQATADTRSLGRRLAGFIDRATEGRVPTQELDQGLLGAITVALSDDRRAERVGAAKRIDARRVTHSCIEYARAVGRIPSITEMCLVAHVSERGLRRAFNEVYGAPPATFFRVWALGQARRRLKSAGSDEQVSRVAADLGFGHLGRFSVRYKQTFGESPSSTMQSVG